MLDAAIFNLVVGNADAHGKNFSLLYRPEATVLAPQDDLICTAAYPELSAKPAMEIAGTTTLKELTPRTWLKFSEDIAIAAPYVRRRIKEICLAVTAHAPEVARTIADAGFEKDTLNTYVGIVHTRADLIAMTV